MNNNKVTLGLMLLMGMTVIMSIGATNDIATRYIKERTRIVAQDTETIPGKIITHYLKGKKSWATTNNIAVINRVVDRPVKYSKLKLINAAKAAGKWADVKAAIQAMDLEDEWQACQFITSDYPAYVAATNAVISRGIATEAEVKAFMRQAEDN
jgi:hypothetical protein